jgi:hypothetical protein
MPELQDRITRKTILLLLGVTKAVASTQRTIPGKWHNVFDSVRVSSQTAHLKLIEVDREAAAEFYDMEEEFRRKIGKGKLYEESDIDDARQRIERVDFTQNPTIE